MRAGSTVHSSCTAHMQACRACTDAGSWVLSATLCSATRCTARRRCASYGRCARDKNNKNNSNDSSSPRRADRSACRQCGYPRAPSRCTLGSSGLQQGRPGPRTQPQVAGPGVVAGALAGVVAVVVVVVVVVVVDVVVVVVMVVIVVAVK